MCSVKSCSGIKIVSHHHGAMVPFFTDRFDTQRRNFKQGVCIYACVCVCVCERETKGERGDRWQHEVHEVSSFDQR